MEEGKLFIDTFWEDHPDAEAISAFKALRNKRGDITSSRILRYIELMHDPEHEYMQRVPKTAGTLGGIETPRADLLKEFCGIKKADLNSQLFKDAEAWFTENYMSVVKQVFSAFNDKIHQARQAISAGVIASPEDIAMYDAAMKSFKSLVNEYEASKAMFIGEMRQKKAARQFGKEEAVRPVDEGNLYD